MLTYGQRVDWRWLSTAEMPVWYPSVKLLRCPDGTADWARAAFLIRTGNLLAAV